MLPTNQDRYDIRANSTFSVPARGFFHFLTKRLCVIVIFHTVKEKVFLIESFCGNEHMLPMHVREFIMETKWEHIIRVTTGGDDPKNNLTTCVCVCVSTIVVRRTWTMCFLSNASCQFLVACRSRRVSVKNKIVNIFEFFFYLLTSSYSL